jgi:hypothetical protein
VVEEAPPLPPAGLRALVRRFLPMVLVLALLFAFFVFTAYAGSGRS